MAGFGKFVGIGFGVIFGGMMALQVIGESATSAHADSAQIESKPAVLRGASSERQGADRAAEGVESKRTETPAQSSAKQKQAEDSVALLINLSGNLCAKPIDVKQVDEDHFGVRCIKFRNGRGRANYLVNARTNDVTSI